MMRTALVSLTLLAQPALAEQLDFYFVGGGFFPDIQYGHPSDDVRLHNAHNVAVTFRLDGDVEMYGDGDDVSDNGIQITLNPGEMARFEADNCDCAGSPGLGVEIVVLDVGGAAYGGVNGIVSFDEEPEVGM